MNAIGYTEKQAERLKRQLDGDVAHIEDIAYGMRRRVPDVGESLPHNIDNLLEAIRENVYALHDVIDRRTRQANS